MSELETLVLGTFSFYEPMTFSKVILDIDSNGLKEFPDFSREDLEFVIKSLVQQKHIKAVKIDKEIGWIRVKPRRSWWKRIFPL